MTQPSHLIDYQLGSAGTGHRWHFLRCVGLFPVVGRVRMADVPAATRWVQSLWRRRVDQMASWGMPPAAQLGIANNDTPFSRKWRLLNCPPWFVPCRPCGLPCATVGICPFCWTRTAVKTWTQIDGGLFPATSAVPERPIATASVSRDDGWILEFDPEDDGPAPPAAPAEATTPPEPRRDDLAMIIRSIVYTLPLAEEERDAAPVRGLPAVAQ